MFKTVAAPTNVQTYKWLDELPARSLAYQDMLLYHMSQYAVDQVKSYVPNSKDNVEYINSIQQAVLNSSDKKNSVYAIVLNPKSNQVKQLNTEKSIIYIHPLKKSGKPDPKVLILERYNPWTLDTLPFMPDKRNAKIETKLVAEKDVLRIFNLRKKDSILWKRELTRVGAVIPKDTDIKDFAKQNKVTTDMSQQALRIEFGLDGKTSGSHWRKGIIDLSNSGIQNIIRTKKLDRILNDPNFTDWKSPTPAVKVRITPSELRSFTEFQKKLGFIQ